MTKRIWLAQSIDHKATFEYSIPPELGFAEISKIEGLIYSSYIYHSGLPEVRACSTIKGSIVTVYVDYLGYLDVSTKCVCDNVVEEVNERLAKANNEK